MATDPEEPSRALIRPSPRLTIAHSRSEAYSTERKTVHTVYSESVVRAEVGVARAQFTYPVALVCLACVSVVGLMFAVAGAAALWPAAIVMTPIGVATVWKFAPKK